MPSRLRKRSTISLTDMRAMYVLQNQGMICDKEAKPRP